MGDGTRRGHRADPWHEAQTILEENLAAAEISLTMGDLAEIDAAMPTGAAAGDRYAEAGANSGALAEG